VLFCALAELAAFVALVGFDMVRGRKLLPAISGRAFMHPLAPKTVVTVGAFDPVVVQRYEPGSKAGNLRINEYGFVANGPDDAVLRTFPRKAEDEFRIIMLGASSLAGTVLRSDESQTIAAHLERALNSGPAPGKRFAVLNFGILGNYSYSELRTFFAQVIHLKPDLVIALDGWTDAVEGAFGAERGRLQHGLVNWSELSYRHNDIFNRVAARRDGIPYVFTYVYLALKQLGIVGREAADNRREKYEGLAWYRISGDLIAEHRGMEFVLPRNVEAMAAYAEAAGFCFIGYLQPFAELARPANAEEQAALDDSHVAMANAGHAYYLPRAAFAARLRGYFSSYAEAYRGLAKKYSATRCTRFADLTAMFENTPERVYLDSTHYNERGNELVARRIAGDVRRLVPR
jgi:hypothetical protein